MYRDLGDVETDILKMIIHMGAQDGVQKVSSKKIAKACNISTGTIFIRFGTMRNALDQAAQYFDRLHMQKIMEMVERHQSNIEMWDYFLDCLMEYPDGALYYTSYTNVFGFDPTPNNPRANEFLQLSKAFFATKKKLTDAEYLLMWDYVTSMAFYYADKFLHYMPYNEENKTMVKQIVFQGIDHLL